MSTREQICKHPNHPGRPGRSYGGRNGSGIKKSVHRWVRRTVKLALHKGDDVPKKYGYTGWSC